MLLVDVKQLHFKQKKDPHGLVGMPMPPHLLHSAVYVSMSLKTTMVLKPESMSSQGLKLMATFQTFGWGELEVWMHG
jgi:hypothetical protein